MAETRFFKKFGDNFKFVFADNRNCVLFTTLDGLVGYFATNVVAVLEEFDKAIKEQRSAINEISQEEFHRDFVEKKTKIPPINGKDSNQNWREELSGMSRTAKGPLERFGAQAVAAVVGVSGRSDIIPDNSFIPQPSSARVVNDTVTTPTKVEPIKDFKPNLGKKGKKE